MENWTLCAEKKHLPGGKRGEGGACGNCVRRWESCGAV